MKIKQTFFGVHCVMFNGKSFLAQGGNDVPALLNTKAQATAMCRILRKGGVEGARVVKVKATFKIKGGRK